MRQKLQKFTDFTQSLLPHEVVYLQHIQQFQDDVRRQILDKIGQYTHHWPEEDPFDTDIDKRKYSHLKHWIEEKLEEIDVDSQYLQIKAWHQGITTDTITPEQEKALLKKIKEYPLSMSFYFAHFYDLVFDFRQYLLIRMRYAEHRLTDQFIQTHREAYAYSRSVAEKMHTATADIVNQYHNNASESILWEEWLTQCFYDPDLDGHNRYMALVRLTFLYNNYRNFEKLRTLYDHIDGQFTKGIYYSKRLLVNYYGNRLLLHARFKEYDKATYYGYLSIRVKTSDYLHYVNNLASILLRTQKNAAALALMRQAHPEMKRSHSFHNKVGFMAFYAKCLNVNGLSKNAESYIEAFLRVYKHEVFEQRWHIFFTAYLEALLIQKKYAKLCQVVKRFKLLEKERQYRQNPAYLPTILLYNALAELREEIILPKAFQHLVGQEKQKVLESPEKAKPFQTLLQLLSEHLSSGERTRLLDTL